MSLLHNCLKEIPIEKKTHLNYLELGYYEVENRGNNFKQVCGFKKQISVDMGNKEATYTMHTEEFFKINKEKFDMIYIDAGHDLPNVIKDYNNSIKCLKKNGIIIIHDLYPPNEELASTPGYCGDGYKFLNYLNEKKEEKFITYVPDVGITAVQAPTNSVNIKNIKNITYKEFSDIDKKNWGNNRIYKNIQRVFIILKKIKI